MKVLGIGSSSRREGNTDLLLAEFLRGAADKGAETKTINLGALRFSTCIHCDKCLQTGKCAIQDPMQDIYTELEQADVIVIASPVQFAGPTAPLKAMIDRCQCLWARKYVLKIPPIDPAKKRRGFFIAVAGTKIKGMFEPSSAIIKTWFHVLNIEFAGELLVNGVDAKGEILAHPDAMARAYEAGQKIAEVNQ